MMNRLSLAKQIAKELGWLEAPVGFQGKDGHSIAVEAQLALLDRLEELYKAMLRDASPEAAKGSDTSAQGVASDEAPPRS